MLLGAGVQSPSLNPRPSLDQEIPETPQIKEEPEEQSVKQEEEQLPVSVPESSAVTVKKEESSPLHQAEEVEQKREWCPLCGQSFESRHYLLIHIKDHAGESTNTGAEERNEQQETPHKRLTEEKHYNCLTCKKKFPKVCHLNAHMKTHSGTIVFNCAVCQMDFTELSTFKLHLITHQDQTCAFARSPLSGGTPGKSEEQLKQEISETPQIKEEPEELSVKQEEEELLVSESDVVAVVVKSEEETTASEDKEDASGAEGSVCPERFENEQTSEESPHTCPICKKAFKGASFLRAHIKTHPGQRPYHCSVCQKSFPQNAHLQRHMRMHTGEKPHRCSLCDKAFARKSTLELHVRSSHTGERPYRCQHCNTAYADKYSLTRHMQYTRTHMGALASENTEQNVLLLLVPTSEEQKV